MLVVGIALAALFCTSSKSLADGKKVFLTANCNNCHTVKAQGIAKKGDNEEKTTDLSKVGATRTADWLAKYLQKEEAIGGKKHKKKWSGTPADLADVSKWMAGLK